MKKLATFTILSAAICLAGTYPNEFFSTGAPASATGAPDDGTCGNIGCHDDNQVNSGSASSLLLIDGGISNYVPGETYQIEVSISEPGINRFGYQLLAISDNDNMNAGEFIITDNQRTQIVTNYADTSLADRQYLTYTYDGTSEYSSGLGYWTAQWTAPSQDVGPITFYYATVSANNDGTDNGDVFYLNQLTLNSAATNVVELNKDFDFQAFPNPTSDYIQISSSYDNLSIYSVDGTLMKSLNYNQQGIDIQEFEVGTYFVVMTKNNESFIEKLIIK